MSMSVGSPDGDDEDQVMSEINTTPLVDIMLVLLIIFLITSPVVLKTIKVELPSEKNQVLKTNPRNINLTIDKDGQTYWDQKPFPDHNALVTTLKEEAKKNADVEVHIRADQTSKYEAVGKAILAAQRAGIAKVGFITEPKKGGG